MPFVTKVDYSDNRQVKQFQLTNTNLSGTTVFGLDYSGLTGGVNLDTVVTTGTYSNITSTFSGNSVTTTFFFGQVEMVAGAETLEPITNITSGDTQIGIGYEGVNPNIIDGNTAFNSYTGSTFDLTVTSIEEVGVNEWTGTTNSTTVTLLSGDSTDFTGRTIWVDVKGITKTDKLIIKDYIDFNTGTTQPSNISGRVYYDNNSSSLAYFPDIDQDVKVELGQQLYIRGFNSTGSDIPKGSVLSIESSIDGLPNFILRYNTPNGRTQVVGLAASNIPNNSNGLALSQGILSGVTTNDFNVGDILYANPSIPGSYTSFTTPLPLSARTDEIGYVLSTGVTEGQIYVIINNEGSNLTITNNERNILEGNAISTGTYDFTGITKSSNTTFDVAPIKGWVVKNTYEFATFPDVTNISFEGVTGLTTPFLNTTTSTYVLINESNEIVLFPSEPTPQERRENIYLGKVVHPDKISIQNIANIADYTLSPVSIIRDLFTPIKLINDGIIVSPNGANLSINLSSGRLFGYGIGWYTNELSPNVIDIPSSIPATFQYRTSTGGTFTDIIEIEPLNYDVNGVVTIIPGNLGSQLVRATNQRVYLFPSGVIRVQYGQVWYTSISEAIGGLSSEPFIEYVNHRENGILIATISITRGCINLSDSSTARIAFTSKFGELFGGTGGLSTTTLQQAYNNSINPEIITNTLLGSFNIRGGTGNDSDSNISIENNSGQITGHWLADGSISATTVSAVTFSATTYLNLPSSSGATTISDNQVAVGTGTGIEGTTGFTWDSSRLFVDGEVEIPNNKYYRAIDSGLVSRSVFGFSPTIAALVFGSGGMAEPIKMFAGSVTPGLTLLNATNEVGIGTDTPESALHVLRTSNTSDTNQIVARFSNDGTSEQVRIALTNNSDTSTDARLFGNQIFSTSAGSGWADYEARSLNFWTGEVVGAASNRLTILPNGNIGVNSLAPTEKLHVNGNVKATSLIINTGQSLKWGTGATRISGIDGSNITITPNNIESVKFNANGNTGFGVTAIATERVEVNGNVKATGFIGSGTSIINTLSATTYLNLPSSKAALVFSPTGNTSGIIKSGRTETNYGPVGTNAIDLSNSTSPSTTKGATGQYSTAFGFNTTASGTYSIAFGRGTIASGPQSMAFGFNTTASGNQSMAWGDSTIATGNFSATAWGTSSIASGYVSTAFGQSNIASSLCETSIGLFSTTGNTGNNLSWVGSDRVFNIGNGTSLTGRSDALTILKYGDVIAPSLSIGIINSGDTRVLITKEYANTTYNPITNSVKLTGETSQSIEGAIVVNSISATTVSGATFLEPIITITGDTTLTLGNSEVIIDALGGAITVTLPSVGAVPIGKKYTFIGYDATNSISIDTNGVEQIRQIKADTTTSFTILSGDILKISNTGVYWQITNKV
jgi:hypothetical protein|tara:strand:- start:10616 stop:14842 length:4227 start_codon:yes stop_codon:yes gene_type:complete